MLAEKHSEKEKKEKKIKRKDDGKGVHKGSLTRKK